MNINQKSQEPVKQTISTLTGGARKSEEIVAFGSKLAPTSSASNTESTAKTTVTKTLHFPVIPDQATVYHQVRGQKRRGLLVDPGAGAGIAGSGTLRDILENVPMLQENPGVVEWTERFTFVTGISGQGDATLAHVTFPFHITQKILGSFSADVLGNEGSLCPALLPNPSLRRLHAGVLTEWFENGDGLLVFGDPTNQEDQAGMTMLRILLTESGHYILPGDQVPEDTPQEHQAKVNLYMKQICNTSMDKWKDVHPKIKHYFNSDSSEVARTTHVKPEQGEMRDPPEDRRDRWEIDESLQLLTRVHLRPRLALFVPQDEHCPISTDRLKMTRMTKSVFKDGRVEHKTDNWLDRDNHLRLHDKWTGTTTFHINPTTSTIDHRLISNDTDNFAAEEDLETYQGDYFPDHLTNEQKHYLHLHLLVGRSSHFSMAQNYLQTSYEREWCLRTRSALDEAYTNTNIEN